MLAVTVAHGSRVPPASDSLAPFPLAPIQDANADIAAIPRDRPYPMRAQGDVVRSRTRRPCCCRQYCPLPLLLLPPVLPAPLLLLALRPQGTLEWVPCTVLSVPCPPELHAVQEISAGLAHSGYPIM